MSEQRLHHHPARRAAPSPLLRAYLAALTRRLFARGEAGPTGPGALNHAIATRITQAQRSRSR